MTDYGLTARVHQICRFAISLVTLVWVGIGLAGPESLVAQDWPFPRGDVQSSGSVATELPDSLTVVWEFKADEAIEVTPVVSGDRVVVGDVMGTLYALSRSDGKQVWRHDFDTGFLASPIIAGDKVIAGDIDGSVYALALDDGKQLWKQSTDGEISGSATVFGNQVLVASQDGKLYCYDLETGKPVWTYQADDQIRCSPTIAGEMTLLGGCDAKLHGVDLKTGQAAGDQWPIDGPTGSTPAVRDAFAIVPIMDGVVFGFDWKQKKMLWRYEDFDQGQEYRSSAAINDKVAIVSSQRKNIDALDLKTGKRLWRYTLRRRADASPVIAGDDVWVPASDGRLVRLSVDDGSEKWVYEIRGSFVSGVAIAGKQLFVADDEGVVRCFQ
ncbi:outer membrane protein assembly factor BamB family protein [Roseiconus lacunae]|uniref:outer membrane protein assembly factor BamB family protein n=1 Tax=Roseiconus lacunae TaxID=2605694 RepID=UPI0011F0C245|nr:PQQ-binding-like beta-propeller repeat protein [Roseiconus lacunae]MCD0458697.1 PQQ-binding-like beta-propeller repeat protein [Roseiconus lacunae]